MNTEVDMRMGMAHIRRLKAHGCRHRLETAAARPRSRSEPPLSIEPIEPVESILPARPEEARLPARAVGEDRPRRQARPRSAQR